MERVFKPNFENISTSPGVYQFISDTGAVLYVGKAKNLKNRIKSYYVKDHGRGPRIDLLLAEARNITTIETESEIEAVLLEAELIKKIKPKYNVSLKDDKSFLLVEFSQDEYPKVNFVRSKEKTDKKNKRNIYGPYPSGDLLKKSLKYLRKLFPYRDCSENKFSSYKKRQRTCLYGDIGLCLGPCAKEVSVKEYCEQIKMLKDFLKGQKKQIIKKLKREMLNKSKNVEYEKAAKIRDKVFSLEHLREVAIGIRDQNFESAKILFKRIEAYDISNIFGQHAVGSMSVIIEGKKEPSQYRKFKIKTVYGANDIAMITEVLKRRLNNKWDMADLLVIDGGAIQLKAAQEVLQERKLDIPLVSIAKGPKRDKNELHYVNSDLAKYIKATPEAEKAIILARDEAHRFAINYYRSIHRKKMISKD